MPPQAPGIAPRNAPSSTLLSARCARRRTHLRAPAQANLPRLVATHVGDAVLLEQLVIVLDSHAHLPTSRAATSTAATPTTRAGSSSSPEKAPHLPAGQIIFRWLADELVVFLQDVVVGFARLGLPVLDVFLHPLLAKANDVVVDELPDGSGTLC